MPSATPTRMSVRLSVRGRRCQLTSFPLGERMPTGTPAAAEGSAAAGSGPDVSSAAALRAVRREPSGDSAERPV